MFKKTKAMLSLVLGLMLILGALVVSATADGVTVNATVNKVGTLTLSSTTVDFGAVIPGTIEKASALTATVQTNSNNWNLTQKISTDFTPSNGKKIGLSWRQGSASYAAMGTTVADVVGSGVIGTASTPYALDYQLDVPWELAPSNYSASLVYTLSF